MKIWQHFLKEQGEIFDGEPTVIFDPERSENTSRPCLVKDRDATFHFEDRTLPARQTTDAPFDAGHFQ
ncbi:MAG TPA: hypothetical protein PKA41_01850 [Verrucomicrobiota bacterium]|nr:hypothetical protein [Verrucomicrobiota bacterium]